MADFELRLANLRERQQKLQAQLAASLPPKTAPAGAIDGFGVICRCGHHAPIDLFCVSPAGLPLARGHYQCPACGEAWTVKTVEPAKVSASGFVFPARRACVPVQATL
jgi:hypothetical protein